MSGSSNSVDHCGGCEDGEVMVEVEVEEAASEESDSGGVMS
jgi:hypothetical protein